MKYDTTHREISGDDMIEPKRRFVSWSEFFSWEYWTDSDPLHYLDPRSRAYQRIKDVRDGKPEAFGPDGLCAVDYLRHGSAGYEWAKKMILEGWTVKRPKKCADGELGGYYCVIRAWKALPELQADDEVLPPPHSVMARDERITSDPHE